MAKIHRSFQELFCFFCCVLAVCRGDDQDWSVQFKEMKNMLTALNARLSAFEGKLNHVNILDYAFKATTIDNHLSSINNNIHSLRDGMKEHAVKINVVEQDVKALGTRLGVRPAPDASDQVAKFGALSARMDQVFTKVESIEEAVKNLKTPECSRTGDAERTGRRSSAIAEKNTVHTEDLATKVDDYGKKLLKAVQDVQDAGKQHREDLKGHAEVVRSGFSKVISKVEQTLEMEGQIANVISILQQVAAKITAVADQFLNFLVDFTAVKDDVSASRKVLTNVDRNMTLLANMTKTEVYQIAELTRAVQLGKDMEPDMKRLSSLESKIERAIVLSKQLMSSADKQTTSNDFKVVAQNLSTSLTEIGEMSVPLLSSVPYSFESFQAIVGDALSFVKDKAQCRSNQMVGLEIQRLKDNMLQFASNVSSGRGGRMSEQFNSMLSEAFNTENQVSTKAALFKLAQDLLDALMKKTPQYSFWTNEKERKQVVVDCTSPVINKYHEKAGEFPDDSLIGLVGAFCELNFRALSVY